MPRDVDEGGVFQGKLLLPRIAIVEEVTSGQVGAVWLKLLFEELRHRVWRAEQNSVAPLATVTQRSKLKGAFETDGRDISRTHTHTRGHTQYFINYVRVSNQDVSALANMWEDTGKDVG